MKPYGRESKLQGTGPWKTDVHPPKGYSNWWENFKKYLSRSSMKQRVKKEIKKELSNN